MRSKIIAMALAITLVFGAAHAQPKKSDPLERILTAPALADGWARSGDVEVYVKDTVFDLIDGEAELYFPYGFRRVVAVAYERAADADNPMSAEVYEMGSPLDAFGIYSNYREADDSPAAVGADAFHGSTQALFYQERYFVKLRCAKPEEKAKALLSCAAAISKALPPHKANLPELALLDVPGIEPRSVRYIAESVLGYRFFKRGLLAETILDEKDEDERPMRVFVVFHANANEAQRTLAKYLVYLDENDGACENLDGARTLLIQDPLHKGVILEQAGGHLIGVGRWTDQTKALKLLQGLRAEVRPKTE